MVVHIQRVRVPLVHPVGREDGVEAVFVVAEVAEGGQEMVQPGRIGLGHKDPSVEGSGPLPVLGPVGTDHGGVVQQPVRQGPGPDGVHVLVYPAVLVEDLCSALGQVKHGWRGRDRGGRERQIERGETGRQTNRQTDKNRG